MSILTRPEQAASDIVAVEDLPAEDVLDEAELMCSYCANEQSIAEMHYDFEGKEFVCATCAQMLLDGTMHDDDDVPSDLESCMDELGEDDFDPEGAL